MFFLHCCCSCSANKVTCMCLSPSMHWCSCHGRRWSYMSVAFVELAIYCLSCAVSYPSPCSSRTHRAPSSSLPYHTVSAPSIPQGYSQSLARLCHHSQTHTAISWFICVMVLKNLKYEKQCFFLYNTFKIHMDWNPLMGGMSLLAVKLKVPLPPFQGAQAESHQGCYGYRNATWILLHPLWIPPQWSSLISLSLVVLRIMNNDIIMQYYSCRWSHIRSGILGKHLFTSFKALSHPPAWWCLCKSLCLKMSSKCVCSWWIDLWSMCVSFSTLSCVLSASDQPRVRER